MMELGELPAGWAVACLDDLLTKISNGANVVQYEDKTGYPISRIETIWNESIDLGRVRYIRESDAEFVEKYALQHGDILFSHINSDAHLGKTALFRSQVPILIHGINLLLLRPAQGISPDFLNYQFKYLRFRGAFIDAAQRAVNQSSINQKKLKSLEFVVPPIAEQHRIVAKIEELFSELDQGVASLKTAREQLKVYRQSLLKNAFAGKLTAAWRAAHADQLETAAALQQRIARERQTRYQQQLADWQTAGQAGPKPKPPKPLSPLTAEELAELPELPEGWVFVRAEEIADFITKGTTPSKELLFSGNGEIPFIKVYNLTMTGALDFSIDPTFVSRETHQGFLNRSKVYPGDVLMNIVGPPLGKVSIVPPTYPEWNINQAIAIFRTTAITPKLLAKYLAHETTVRSMMKKSKATAGQFNLTLEICRETLIPLCGKLEQEQIELLIDEKLSEADQLELTLATALQQAEALRQSILKKAFCGQLVKQDKNEEPATALLERIRATKAVPAKGKGRRAASQQPEVLELQAPPGQVIPFPVALPGIAAKDLHAGILAMAYRLHEQHPDRLQHFGHVKAEKISHLVEAHLGLDLERQPFKDAAGPNDHPQLKKVEHRARMANWFDVTRLESGKYVFHPKSSFDRLLTKTHQALGARLAEVERLLELMLPMTMRQAEIVATVYAAWNNLLLLGKSPSDEEIVTEARENWHESKLRIERDKFFTALNWMRGKGLIPSGLGRFVAAKGE